MGRETRRRERRRVRDGSQRRGAQPGRGRRLVEPMAQDRRSVRDRRVHAVRTAGAPGFDHDHAGRGAAGRRAVRRVRRGRPALERGPPRVVTADDPPLPAGPARGAGGEGCYGSSRGWSGDRSVSRVAEPRRRGRGPVAGHGLQTHRVRRPGRLEPRPGEVAGCERIPRLLQAIARGVVVRSVQARLVARAEAQVVDVLHEVGAGPLEELGLPPRQPFDRREDEAGGVEDRPQGADPGQVVVAGAEVAEERIGNVGVEDLDGPALPIEEQLRQATNEAELGVRFEEGDRRRRSTCRRLERDHLDLAALVRAVQGEQERDDEGDDAQAADRGRGDDHPGERPIGDEVPEAQRQDRRRGEVQRAPEIGRDGPQLVAERVQDQPVPDDQARPSRPPAARSSRPVRTVPAAGRRTGRAGRPEGFG